VADAYRRADSRLGWLTATLDALYGEVNLIVVSDHGFDFRHHHHTHAPPGLFLAHGPAFKRGRRIDGLSVYDVAPMVLHALGLPVAEDMPATAAKRYRRPFRAPGPAVRIATYERGPAGDARLLEPPRLEETKRRLRALGYLH
jgi:predicted AlkP superfamily phosphohydrolase/phosphomutase